MKTQTFVFFTPDPHLLEGGKSGQDGASDPGGEFAIVGGRDLDLDLLGGDCNELLEESCAESFLRSKSRSADRKEEDQKRGLRKRPGKSVELPERTTLEKRWRRMSRSARMIEL